MNRRWVVLAALSALLAAQVLFAQPDRRLLDAEFRQATILCKAAADSGSLADALARLGRIALQDLEYPGLKSLQESCAEEQKKQRNQEDLTFEEAKSAFQRKALDEARAKFQFLASRRTAHAAEARRYLSLIAGAGPAAAAPASEQDYANLELAIRHFKAKNYSKARPLLEMLISKGGNLALDARKYRDQIELRDKNDALLQQGMQAFRQRRYEDALAAFQQIEQQDPGYPNLRTWLAQTQTVLGKTGAGPPGAPPTLGPSSARTADLARIERGKALFAERDYSGALKMFREVQQPDSAELQGWIEKSETAMAEAAKRVQLEKMLKDGQTLMGRKQYVRAHVQFQRARALAPRDAQVQKLLAQAAAAMKQVGQQPGAEDRSAYLATYLENGIREFYAWNLGETSRLLEQYVREAGSARSWHIFTWELRPPRSISFREKRTRTRRRGPAGSSSRGGRPTPGSVRRENGFPRKSLRCTIRRPPVSGVAPASCRQLHKAPPRRRRYRDNTMGVSRESGPVFLTLLLLGAGLALAGPAAWAQKPPSAKDLLRMAQVDQKNNQWEQARQKLKQAAAQKPKDKNIAEALRTTENYLADLAAARALTLCEQLEIDKCEGEVKRAASFAVTPRVQEAQARLALRTKEVQERWNRAQQMMATGQLLEAHAELENLTRFSYLFPNLAQEKERLRRLRVDAAVAQGGQEMAAQKWDAAAEAFGAALRLDPGNSEATRGLEAVRQEKEAATSFQQAQNAFQSQAYQVAYEANQKALRLFPARQPYRELARQIGAEWSKVLMEEARQLSANPDSLKDNQRALEALEMVRRLDPQAAGLAEELRTVRLTVHSIYLQKAGEYEAVADNSRIATAYAYYMNAQQTNPGGEFAFAAKVREVSSVFARKRSVQVLVNVENLSPAPPAFSEVVARRARAVLQKIGLPDVKLRTLDEYQKNPGEDPQFVENRPDSKSPTALLTVELTNYESETAGGDKPVEKPSRFISGQEMAPNPAYEKLQAEYRKISAALAAVKPGKPTREGYTAQDLTFLQQQLTSTSREIARDKISDYTYQEFQLGVRALIRMNLEIRDMLEKQLLASENIETADKRSQTEIAGVRDRDVHNLINKPARLPSADQLLRECERNALEQLDDKVQRLVGQYLPRFYAEGEKALREGRTEDALENFLCHWFFYRGRLEEGQARRIRELVKREIGMDLGAAGPALPASS